MEPERPMLAYFEEALTDLAHVQKAMYLRTNAAYPFDLKNAKHWQVLEDFKDDFVG